MHPDTPDCLARFTPEELSEKVHALIEDWSSPTLSPIGLCRAHDLTLVQISAIMQLPMFNNILEHIETIQAARRAHIERKAADLALDRLCYLAHQTPTSAASCKEIRLAVKAILELVAPPSPGGPARGGRAGSSQTHDESSKRVGGVPRDAADAIGGFPPPSPAGGASGRGPG